MPAITCRIKDREECELEIDQWDSPVLYFKVMLSVHERLTEISR